MSQMSEHAPVLLHEAINALHIRPDGFYIDATFGRGGHSRAILEQLGTNGRLLACDQDPTALASGADLVATEPRLTLLDCNFASLPSYLEAQALMGKVDGILLDLGVSSPQLDRAERGFSFMRDGVLDMRMNPRQGQSIGAWLHKARAEEIADVLYHYGDERKSRRIARSIIYHREQAEITHTKQLAHIISQALKPHREKHKHPATRSFQALRIFINRELDVLKQLLDAIPAVLAPQGRLAVISFHSLEDRLVKRFIREQAQGGITYPPELPIPVADLQPILKPIGKQIKASPAELESNPRARSAVLRIAEKP